MASAQATGTLAFYRVTPTGSKVLLYSNDLKALGPSGSSDGTIASTPEKWIFIPAQSAQQKVLRVNDKLQTTFTAAANVTIDASDCEFVLPITLQDGTGLTLGGPDNAADWDAKQAGDTAFVAASETTLCEKTIRQPFAFGSNTAKAFASIENNS